jgi:hypothetical protein
VDAPGLPLGIVFLLVVVLPLGVALFFGLFAFKGMTPLAFRCRRCRSEFQRKPWKPFPGRCPICRARDWNDA